MKIVYILPNNRISGGTIVVLQHRQNLLEMGHDVFLVTQDNSNALNWQKDVEITPFNEFNEMDAYDVAIATFWETVSLLSKINAKRKFYFVQQDERNFYHKNSEIKKVEDTYKRKNIKYFTMAHWIQHWLADEFGQDSFYVPNGIDLSIFKLGKKNKSQKLRFLIEGKIHIPSKGVAEAYDILSKFPCEKWVVSGDGTLPKDWVVDKFFCELTQLQLSDVYRKCDVLLKMSRLESFSLPPLEMMACGGTAIIRKVNGVEDYAVNGENCLIVKDRKEAERAVKELIENPRLANKLRKNALLTAKKWSVERQKKYLATLLDGREKTKLQNSKSSYEYSSQNSMESASQHDLIQSIENHKKYIAELEAINKKQTLELDMLNRIVFAIRDSRLWKIRNKIAKMIGRGEL